jgi:Ni2+-binding GTPase involved in maturation of urease and hydrogenase
VEVFRLVSQLQNPDTERVVNVHGETCQGKTALTTAACRFMSER